MKALIACAAMVMAVVSTRSAPQIVIVGREAEPRRFSEPHLVVHPARPYHFLAAVWTASTSESNVQDRRCSSFVSTDAGAAWTRHEFAIGECYDAQVAIVPDGHAVFVALGKVPNIRPDRPDWLIVFRSNDGGITWDDVPTIIGVRYDHPAVAVDLSSSSRRGWIYVTSHLEWADGSLSRKSAVVVTRSRDGGQTFDHPVFLMPSGLHNSAEMPVVLSDGTLVVSYQDFPWGAVTPRRLWSVRSSDGGVSFSPPHLVTDRCGPPPPMQLTSLAADPNELRVFAACRQAEGGAVVVFASDNRSDSWRGPATAGPAASDRNARRVMTLAVDRSGTVAAMVVERRDDGGDGCHNVTLSISRDGAKSFDQRQMVSSTPCGSSPNDVRARQRFPTYGDYYGLVATAEGRFQVMWPEMRDGASALLTAAIDTGERR
jgi:hypothetical protein